jgi:hypothetical protein
MGKLAEVSRDAVLQAKIDQYLSVVNVEPPKAILKDHPMARGVKYIAIADIENLLTKIFQQWRVEILNSGQLLNSLQVTVRLHYLDLVTGQWTFQDGIGAVAIQVDKGENASNLAAIKSNAIMLGLPAAKSFAIKDAAEHIGKLFGRDMNRKETPAFDGAYGITDDKQAAIIKAAKAKSGN